MAFFRRIGCLVLATVPFIIMMILVMTTIRNKDSLVFTILFKDAGRLHYGANVLLGDRAIGQVRLIQPTPEGTLVGVRISPRFVKQVRRGCTAIIHQPARSGRRQRWAVEIINPEADPPPPPLEPNAQVRGVGGELELQAWRIKSSMKDLGDSLKNALAPFGGKD